jgi:hypothetical protein
MKIRLIPFAFVAVAIALFSCEDESATDSSITDASSTINNESAEVNEESLKKVQNIMHTIPSPTDMAYLVKEAGADYDAFKLNDVKNVSEYSTAQMQALNLGVYGGDLSYTVVFNQNQESLLYLGCTKKLAEKLGLSKAFNDEIIERMELNLDNQDSLLTIISEAYYNIDSYLKENERGLVSAQIIAAGWIEGLYLGTQIATNDPSEKILKRIAEQKVSLQNLIALVDDYNKAGELDFMMEDLNAIAEAYEGVSINTTDNSLSEGEDGVTTIGGPIEVEFAEEDLKKLTELVSSIRSKYIQY